MGRPSILSAQGVEVAPFVGYRFGGDFVEILTGRHVDPDGAQSYGVVLDVPLSNGLYFEGLFSHQHAEVLVPDFFRPTVWRMSVDHWQGGGGQEFGGGRLRPFLAGTLGFTRYAAEADSQLRFTVGGGGGVKLFPASHVGLRLDTRIFATFAEAATTLTVCSGGSCVLALHLNLVWQAEFTAGVVVKFP